MTCLLPNHKKSLFFCATSTVKLQALGQLNQWNQSYIDGTCTYIFLYYCFDCSEVGNKDDDNNKNNDNDNHNNNHKNHIDFTHESPRDNHYVNWVWLCTNHSYSNDYEYFAR